MFSWRKYLTQFFLCVGNQMKTLRVQWGLRWDLVKREGNIILCAYLNKLANNKFNFSVKRMGFYLFHSFPKYGRKKLSISIFKSFFSDSLFWKLSNLQKICKNSTFDTHMSFKYIHQLLTFYLICFFPFNFFLISYCSILISVAVNYEPSVL